MSKIIGWTSYEEIGVAIVNPRAVNKITFIDDPFIYYQESIQESYWHNDARMSAYNFIKLLNEFPCTLRYITVSKNYFMVGIIGSTTHTVFQPSPELWLEVYKKYPVETRQTMIDLINDGGYLAEHKNNPIVMSIILGNIID